MNSQLIIFLTLFFSLTAQATTVSGKLFDSNGNAFKSMCSSVVVYDRPMNYPGISDEPTYLFGDGAQIARAWPNENGDFEFSVPTGGNYSLAIEYFCPK